MDILTGDTAVQHVECRDIDVELGNIRLPEKKSPVEELPAKIPVNRLTLRNIRVHTMIGTCTIDAADLEMRRVSAEYCGQISVSRNPLGGLASIAFRIPFDLGTGSISIDWNGARLPELTSLYPVLWFWGISVDAGSATMALRWTGNLKERLERPDSRIDSLFRTELKGHLQIDGLAVTRDRLTTIWNGTLRTEPDAHGTWKCRLDGSHARDSILIESVFAGSGAGWGIGASGSAEVSTDSWKLLRPLLPGMANIEPGNARILFNGRRPAGKPWQGVISSSLDGFLVDGLPVQTASFSLHTEGRNIQYVSSALAAMGQGEARGTYEPVTGLVKAKINVDDLKSEYFKSIPNDIHGLISGGFQLEGNAARLAEMRVTGHVVVDEPKFSGRTASSLEGNISWDRGAWSVHDPILRLERGQIAFNGVVSDRQIDGELIASDVPSVFLGIDEDVVRGICNFRADVTGTLTNPRYAGELWSDQVKLWDRPVSMLRARIAGGRKHLALEELQAGLSAGGTIFGYLNFDLNAGTMMASRFDIAHVELAQFASLLPEQWRSLEPEGHVDAVFERIPAEHGTMAWQVALTGRKMTIASATIDEVSLSGIQRGHLPERFEAAARIGDGVVTLKGSRLAGAGYTGELRLHEIDLSVLGTVLKVPSPLRGLLSADGTIRWTETEPSGSLTVIVRNLGIGDRFLGNGGGEIVVDKNGVRMDNAAFDRLGLKLAGQMRFDGQNSYDITCIMDRTDLSALPAAYGFRSFHAGDLLVTGSGRLEGRIG